MSLVPLLFSDWWEDLSHPHHLMDQNFGHGLHLDDLPIMPLNVQEQRNIFPQHYRPRISPVYCRPAGDLVRKHHGRSGTSTIKADKDMFQVVLDVQQFSPEEITVKVVDKFVIVEGKHEEKPDEHGSISRQFVRKYLIPEQCNAERVESSLSSNGVLSISCPRKDKPKSHNERQIKIELTGKPVIHKFPDSLQQFHVIENNDYSKMDAQHKMDSQHKMDVQHKNDIAHKNDVQHKIEVKK